MVLFYLTFSCLYHAAAPRLVLGVAEVKSASVNQVLEVMVPWYKQMSGLQLILRAGKMEGK